MPTIMKQATAGISNASVRGRIKQILILIVAIIIGVLISQAANAQHNFHKSKVVHHKIKYKVQIHKSGRVCDILNRKRHYVPKAPLFASNHKPKSKPLAELDAPRAVASLN